MRELYSVEVPGAQYPCSRTFQTDPARKDAWQGVLKKAYGQQAKCLCAGTGQKRLVIRHLKDGDQYVLARMAKSGPEHAVDCRYFSEAEHRSGLQSYVVGVVEEGDDDEVTVRLSHALQIRKKRDKAKAREELPLDKRNPGRTQRAMSLLGLLHLLWTRSDLNVWFPNMQGRRSDAILRSTLQKTAEQIKTHRMTLAQVLLCPAGNRERNREIVSNAQRLDYRLVAVGVLEPCVAAADGAVIRPQKLELMDSAGMPLMYLNEDVWTRAQQSFAREITAWQKGAKTIAIAFVEPSKDKPWGKVIEVALMCVSEMLIPLDSGHEGKVEQWLREQGRKFSKPMRFDHDDATLPDFWLNDLDDEYPMEVFGMNTPEYQVRCNAKHAHYHATYANRLGWWHWNAWQNSDVTSAPPLPPATK